MGRTRKSRERIVVYSFWEWYSEGLEEYKIIYGVSYDAELKKRNFDPNIFQDILIQEMENASFHFGHSYFNKATIAGIIRMTLQKYDGISTDLEDE